MSLLYGGPSASVVAPLPSSGWPEIQYIQHLGVRWLVRFRYGRSQLPRVSRYSVPPTAPSSGISFCLGEWSCIIGGMAATDTTTDTLPENEIPAAGHCACFADQESLGRFFVDHEDPKVRIIAHMSNRQLALSEQVGDLTRGIFKTAGAVSKLQEKVDANTSELCEVKATLENVVKVLAELTTAVGSLSSK